MFILANGDGFNAVAGTHKAVTLGENDANKLIVAVFVLCHKYQRGMLYVGLGRCPDGTGVGSYAAVLAHAANGTFERQYKTEC